MAQRLSTEPIVSADAAPGYGAVFNAGLVHESGRFHLFARGVREGYRPNPWPGARFLDYRSDVLLFESEDGRSYDFRGVLASGSDDGVWSYEDPRVQWAGGTEGSWYMTYTDLPAPGSSAPWRIGLHRLVFSQGRFHLNRSSGRVVSPPGIPDKDAILFDLADGRLGMVHRIHPDMQLAVFDSISDLIDPPSGYWDAYLANLADHVIVTPSPGALGVGAGAPPILTEEGFLFFYHERDASGTYVARVTLLDAASGRPRRHLPWPILAPEMPWERVGDVDDVVFVQGAHRMDDGRIYLTYGASDRVVGAATIDEAALLEVLVNQD